MSSEPWIKKQTLCWQCAKYAGGCSWSARFEPVEGWEAEATIIRQAPTVINQSYLVIKCPEFVSDCEVK